MVLSNSETTQRRSYSSPLRQQQERSTRELILQTLADILAAEGAHEFTIQEVAQRAGLSSQTVYYHFSSREGLIQALLDWYSEAIGVSIVEEVASLGDDLPAIVQKIFELCEKRAALVRAFTILSLNLKIESNTRREMDDILRQILRKFTSNLAPWEAQQAFATIRFLASPDAWLVFTNRLGLDWKEASQAASWAIAVFAEDARRRNEESGVKGI